MVHLFLQDTQEKEGILPERAEEAKLKAKYPSLGQKPGGSDFLMKRLQKGVWGTISDPLTLEPKGIRSVDSLLNADLEVELLGSSEKELEDVKSKANYWKSLIRCQLASDFPYWTLRLYVGAFGYEGWEDEGRMLET